MKRLLYVAFGLMASLPAWGEEPPPGLLTRPETIASPRMPETDASPSEQAPAAALPVAPETHKGGETEAPFREYPYRGWPFYYHNQFTPEHERTIYGPVWLVEHDRDRTLNYPIWPFSGITSTKGRLEKLDLIWPVTGFTHDDAPEREEISLFLVRPLLGYYHETTRDPGGGAVTGEKSGYLPFYYSSEKSGELFRFVFPSFLSNSVPEKGTSLHTLLPLYLYAGRPEGSTLFVLPSYLRIKNLERQLYSFLPFIHSDEDKQGSMLFVFPSYLRIRNSERQLYSFLPFFHSDEGKQGSALFVFPSYFHTAAGNNTSLTGLLPFYLAGDTESGTSFRYVFPTWFEHHREKAGNDSTLTGLLPFYLAGTTESGTSYRYVFPTWLERHREKFDSTWFLPFYTASDDATGGSTISNRTLLWPLYYHRNDEGSGSTTTSVLLNLFYRRTSTSASERYTTLLWPFISFGESPQYRLVRVWPYAYEYQTVDNYRAHYLLWPLIGFGSGDRESTARVLPLFYRRSTPDRSLTVLLPLYLHERTPESRFSLLLPLYANHATAGHELTVLLPLYLHEHTPESRFSLFFPLYANHAAAGHELTVVPPLVWGESGERRFSILFPVWYRGVYRNDTENLLLNTWWSRKGERSSLAFFPLYYRSSAPTGSQTQLINIWWESEVERSSFAFFPLFFHYATPKEAGNLLLNTWWSGGERLERFVFFPLAWYHSPAPEEQDFTFFPLFSYDHKGDESSTFSLLWRLYYQRHDQDGAMSAFLWWLYRTEERPNFRRLMCWPFIDYERNTGTTDEVFTSILLRFMTYERNGKRTRFRLFGLNLYES